MSEDPAAPGAPAGGGPRPGEGGLVFAAIAPHGSLAIPEALPAGESRAARATQAGMAELGRRFEAARPDRVIVLTPHGAHVEGCFAVVEAGRLAGGLADWGAPQIRLEAGVDRELAAAVKDALRSRGLPAVGVSFGGNEPARAVMPMDWGVLIPLWFLGGRSRPPVPVVAVSPARDLDPGLHVEAGRAIAAAAGAGGGRVALVASADHGHGHAASGPYGQRPESEVYDRLVVAAVAESRLERLAAIEPGLVEAAAADSWWQLLMLHGALGEAWTLDLLSYEHPTYFGMLCAAARPRAGASGLSLG